MLVVVVCSVDGNVIVFVEIVVETVPVVDVVINVSVGVIEGVFVEVISVEYGNAVVSKVVVVEDDAELKKVVVSVTST